MYDWSCVLISDCCKLLRACRHVLVRAIRKRGALAFRFASIVGDIYGWKLDLGLLVLGLVGRWADGGKGVLEVLFIGLGYARRLWNESRENVIGYEKGALPFGFEGLREGNAVELR